MLKTLSAADLARRSKEKFTLSQGRLRRDQNELGLLSLYGSLTDGFCSYLVLHRQTPQSDDFAALLEQLQADTAHPLQANEVTQLEQLRQHHARIMAGEALTLPAERYQAYQQLVAHLLHRYGVLVASSETAITSRGTTKKWQSSPGDGLFSVDSNQPRRYLPLAVGVALVALVGFLIVQLSLVGLTGVAELSSQLGTSGAEVTDTTQPASPSRGQDTVATPLADARFTAGQTVYVRADLEDDVPLRVEPGTASDNSVRLYLAPETAVQVVDGPTRLSGANWWQVRAFNQVGWCREDELVSR